MTIAKKVFRLYWRRVDNTWYCAQLWTTHLKRDDGKLENTQREVIWVNSKPHFEKW